MPQNWQKNPKVAHFLVSAIWVKLKNCHHFAKNAPINLKLGNPPLFWPLFTMAYFLFLWDVSKCHFWKPDLWPLSGWPASGQSPSNSVSDLWYSWIVLLWHKGHVACRHLNSWDICGFNWNGHFWCFRWPLTLTPSLTKDAMRRSLLDAWAFV